MDGLFHGGSLLGGLGVGFGLGVWFGLGGGLLRHGGRHRAAAGGAGGRRGALGSGARRRGLWSWAVSRGLTVFSRRALATTADAGQAHGAGGDHRVEQHAPVVEHVPPPAGCRWRCRRRPRTGFRGCSSPPGGTGAPRRARRPGRCAPAPTSAASSATSAPAPMAMPVSARVKAGASLMPSPTMATRPSACRRRTSASLPAGQHARHHVGRVKAHLGGDIVGGGPGCRRSKAPRACPARASGRWPPGWTA